MEIWHAQIKQLKGTGGRANQGRTARFSKPDKGGSPAKKKEEPKKLDDGGSPKKKPDPKHRPGLILGSKKRKGTPIKREQKSLREIWGVRKRVDLCIPHLPVAM